MLKEILKKFNLNEEQIASIEEEMKKNKVYTTSLEKADERYEKLKRDKESLETQLSSANTTLEDLKKSAGDNEELKKKLATYEEDKKAQELEYKERLKELALNNELVKVNVNSLRSAKAELDMTKIIYNEDTSTFVGLSDQIEAWRKDKPWLFKDAELPKTKKKYGPSQGTPPGEGSLTSLMKSKDFNLTEYLKTQKGGE